jgi:hypothetical protein
MVMNHDDSAFNRHPNPARGCAESVNWNLKGADISITFSIVKLLFERFSSNISTFVAGYGGLRTFMRLDRSWPGARLLATFGDAIRMATGARRIEEFSLSNNVVSPSHLGAGKRCKTSKPPHFTKSGQELDL